MRTVTKAEIDGCLSCTKPPSACNFCNGPKPSRRGKSGYPKEIVDAALGLYDAGCRIGEIARTLGVSQASVSLWLKKRWEGTL